MSRGSIEAVLFDKDGTLFDFQASWSRWAEAAIRRLGAQDTERERALAEAMGFDRRAGRFRPESVVIAGTAAETADSLHGAVGGDLAALADELERLALDTPQTPVPGMVDALAQLATSRRLGVVTNDSEGAAERHLDDAGIRHHFSFVAGADSGYGAKPEPGQILAFLRVANLDPPRAIMVGDSLHDLRAGRAAGVVSVAVLTGVATAADLAPHADAVLPDITHLPAWLAARDA